MVGEGEEVGGQEAGDEVHFSRVISAGGASSYRLNEKEVCNSFLTLLSCDDDSCLTVTLWVVDVWCDRAVGQLPASVFFQARATMRFLLLRYLHAPRKPWW